jgi:hypothetical protein
MAEWVVVESGGRKRALQVRIIVEVITTPAREGGWDEERGEKIYPSPLKVEIVTTAAASTYEDGGDYPDRAQVTPHPYTVTFYGDEAKTFLGELFGPRVAARVG